MHLSKYLVIFEVLESGSNSLRSLVFFAKLEALYLAKIPASQRGWV
jgi:hypothetical protein